MRRPPRKYLEFLGSGPPIARIIPISYCSLANRHVESVEYYERANDEGNANHYVESYLEACSLSLDALDSLCLRSSQDHMSVELSAARLPPVSP